MAEVASWALQRDPDGDTFYGIVRYRAVTEPEQAVAA
jgi:hypothetical protein